MEEVPLEGLESGELEAPIPETAKETDDKKEATATEKKEGRGKGKGRARGKGKEKAKDDKAMDTTTTDTTATSTTPTPTTIPTPTPTDPTVPKLDRTKSQAQKSEELINSLLKDAKSRDIEVAFAFDTTGSMMSYLNEVKKNLRETITRLMKDIPGMRIAIMAVGDYCDAHTTYAVRSFDLSKDVDAIVRWVDNVAATGGGDFPEAYELALREARSLSWNPVATKALVIIGDATPHPPSYTDQKIFWKDEVSELIKSGVKVYGVQANTNEEAKVFYQEIAELSGGVYLDLKKMPLITDMFLAVCYKEFGVEHLENFKQTKAAEGKLESDLSSMLETLASSGGEKKTSNKSHPYPWYSKENDTITTPSYWWDNAKKTWVGGKAPGGAAVAPSSSVFFSSKSDAPPPKKGKGKKKEEKKEEKPAKKKKEEKKEEKKPAEKKEKKKEEKKKEEKKKEEKKPKRKADDGDKEKKKPKKGAKDEDEDEPKELKRNVSHVVGSGDWKRDRSGRLASLNKKD